MPDSAMPSSSSKASLSCSWSRWRWSASFPSSTASRHWKSWIWFKKVVVASERLYRGECDRNLVDADILLFGLDHPDTLLPHLVDNAKNVDYIVLSDALQDPI